MKRLVLIPLVLVAGTALGGGAAYGVVTWLGVRPGSATPPPPPPPRFVDAGTMTLPVVTTDQRLSGYAALRIELQVPDARVAEVGGRLPLVLDAINRRAWRTPIAAPATQFLPDPAAFEAMATPAAQAALGPGRVVRVVVTDLHPL